MRPLWKGSISFGLVTIPVSLFPATASESDVRFHLLDKRDLRPVRNKREDDKGHEVPWDEVVRGYEYEPDQYVVLEEDEMKAARAEATQSIDIVHFVDGAEIDTTYFETPYYTEPGKAGRKAYALLRETLRRTGRVGVAKVVIRTRQRLCALRTDGPMLVVQLLRWPYQMRDISAFDLPSEDLAEVGVSDAELKMADQLVKSMADGWDPEQYTDTFREELLKLIDEKVKTGKVAAVPKEETAEAPGNVVDIMSLLKRSVEDRRPPADAKPAAQRKKTG